MNFNTNITGITLGILCGYSLYNIYNYISLQKKLDSCNHLLLTVIDMQRRNNNEIKTVNQRFGVSKIQSKSKAKESSKSTQTGENLEQVKPLWIILFNRK